MSLTASQKVERDAEVVRLRMEYPTRTWAWIAAQVSAMKEEWKIGVRMCQTVYAEWQREKTEELAAPVALEIIQEHLQGFRLIREGLAEAARESSGGVAYRPDAKTGEEARIELKPQPNNVIGALKAIADIRSREIELLQETGLLPKNLGRIEMELDLRRLQEVVIVLIEKFVPKADRPAAENMLLEALMDQIPGTAARQAVLAAGVVEG